MYNEVASHYGVSMATGYVLLNIDQERGTPATALGPQMGMNPTSLSRLLKEMEKKGLITREPNPKDGRGVIVHLSKYGRQKRLDARATVINFNESVRQRLDPKKAAVFLEVIEDIHKMINDQGEKLVNNTETKSLKPEVHD